MSRAFPNPFRGATTIELSLPRRMHARLDVFDLRGRLVRKLVDEPLDGGVTRVTWDGRDHAAREVATGIYFCRFVTENKTIARKILLVR
jgi:flagellar hook assembly protein FlgD